MYRVILSAAAALLVATTGRPAIADDRSVCETGTGDDAIAACGRLLALDLNDAVACAYANVGAKSEGARAKRSGRATEATPPSAAGGREPCMTERRRPPAARINLLPLRSLGIVAAFTVTGQR